MSFNVSEWMKAKAVAEACGVSDETVRIWSQKNNGFPKPSRFSRRTVLWKRSEIEAFLASIEDAKNPSPFIRPKE